MSLTRSLKKQTYKLTCILETMNLTNYTKCMSFLEGHNSCPPIFESYPTKNNQRVKQKNNQKKPSQILYHSQVPFKKKKKHIQFTPRNKLFHATLFLFALLRARRRRTALLDESSQGLPGQHRQAEVVEGHETFFVGIHQGDSLQRCSGVSDGQRGGLDR